MPLIKPKVGILRVGDLKKSLKKVPDSYPVFIGFCGMCEQNILAFRGPLIPCPKCASEVELKVLTKNAKG